MVLVQQKVSVVMNEVVKNKYSMLLHSAYHNLFELVVWSTNMRDRGARYTILFSHGNAEDLGCVEPWLEELSTICKVCQQKRALFLCVTLG